jgi:hypothetical protein
VARRLLEDMAANEAREAEQRIRDKIQGRAVAEAHKQGVEVERPWLQEEEARAALRAARTPWLGCCDACGAFAGAHIAPESRQEQWLRKHAQRRPPPRARADSVRPVATGVPSAFGGDACA